jgi:ketosteroid isomerase-like protein
MSEENLALVREALDAYKRGGMDALFEYYDEDIVFAVDPGFPEAGTFRGKDAVRIYSDEWAETFQEFEWEIDDLVEVSDAETLAVFHIHGLGRGSGVRVEMPLAWIITVRDGKAVRIESFLDPVAAFEAAGLSE